MMKGRWVMPNYCNNHITITGPKKVIERLNKSIQNDGKQEGGFLDALVPMPHEIKHTQADGTDRPNLYMKYGHHDWYGWANENWGTKWDVHEVYGPHLENIDKKSSLLTFAFDTAWSPPLTAYETFLEQNPECSITAYYYEPGCDFMGKYEDNDDECLTASDYHLTSPEWEDNGTILPELDDAFGIRDSMAEHEEWHDWDEDSQKVVDFTNGQDVNTELKIGESID